MKETVACDISFLGVSKMFAGRDVLANVSFEVLRGETLCILGRSGTGKSVTLRLMIGLLQPDAGEVRIQNENVAGDADHVSHLRRRMGFLFQSGALFSPFSLKDNLALPLDRFTTKSKSEIDSLVRERLTQVGLEKDLNKMPLELSGGMRKRAGLARALVLEPRILLVDEPTSGLDRITASEIDDLLFDIKKTNQTTMVVVTHDVREARRLGDRLAVLDQGHLLAIGTPAELDREANELVKKLVAEE